MCSCLLETLEYYCSTTLNHIPGLSLRHNQVLAYYNQRYGNPHRKEGIQGGAKIPRGLAPSSQGFTCIEVVHKHGYEPRRYDGEVRRIIRAAGGRGGQRGENTSLPW